MKKLLSTILCVTMVAATMFSCKANSTTTKKDPAKNETVTLKVWGPQEEQKLLTEMAEEFKKAHPNKTYNISFGVVAEGDAQTKYSEDPQAAADVFMFENGQTNALVSSGGLYEITRNKEAVVSANSEGSIDAASVKGKLYAYPMTADNGYFLYYDKSIISEDAVKSVDGILAAADKAGKKFLFDMSNGWYIASFFLGAGCTMSLENGKQVLDFNNDKGVAAGEAIKALTANKSFLTGDDPVITGGMGDTIAAAVTGTWNAAAIKEKLGANFAATKLPTFTMNGNQVQLGSFAGYKLVGVNALTKAPVDAMDFAEFITNEANQAKRFKARAIGPSNKKIADSAEVKANIPLAALALQSKFATPQNSVSDKFWAPAEAFGTAMESKDYSKSIKEMLDAMVAQIQS
ncbi:extracellular solute-binding protein [Paludicola sp. MB14-C6]|uniref:extracellular solute-binding protein n=1 Tax=Paludihabitans sp. MB14-C6 TaxID=3070656 RepID=UPI0027DDE659|nr:extracellular solute-binding protein [Paludicola sp. MB14-C6]WMJ23226.1 extracellular solute-binding protein [Paludicola sp. MB14-C6]